MKLTNNSCVVNITASNAKDNGTWSFYTRETDDLLRSYDYHTTYPVVVKSKYSKLSIFEIMLTWHMI